MVFLISIRAGYALLFQGKDVIVEAGNDHTERKLGEVVIPNAKQIG